MSTRYYLKVLRLVTPETAAKLGCCAETPVFVSPSLDGPKRCAVCTVTYRPLVYQTNAVTVAHHWHDGQNGSGGIYFFVYRSVQLRADEIGYHGWNGLLEPLGHTDIHPDYITEYSDILGRAEAVRCSAILAWCTRHIFSRRQQCPYHVHPIERGLLYSDRCDLSRLRVLLPVCDLDDLPVSKAPFRFTIRDGTVYFQQRS